MKVLKGVLFTLLAIVLILVIAFVVVINLTPRQLGAQNVKIDGKTIEEMGIADTKIINIYKSIKSLSAPKEDKIVTNKFDETAEKDKSKDNFSGSSLENKDDYSSIITDPVIYDTKKIVEYDDVTIAYIFNNVVQNASESSSEAIKALRNAKIQIKELTISLDGEKGRMRIVSLVELGEYKAEIENALGAAKGLFKVPDKVFIVSEISFTVDGANGKMVTTGESVYINDGKDDPVTKAILGVVMSKVEGINSVDDLNDKVGKAVSEVIFNLGGIGSVAMDENIYVYGMSGVKDHKLSLVTHVK